MIIGIIGSRRRNNESDKILIEKELLVGFGQRTKYKWFIKEIKLNRQGKSQAKKLLGEQLKLKFKKRK